MSYAKDTMITESLQQKFTLVSMRSYSMKPTSQPPAEEAFNVLKSAIQKNEGYAWSWHCNIAISCYDSMREAEEIPHEQAHLTGNEAASRFMKLCFDVDTVYTEPTSNEDETVVKEK